ncbi:MAG: Uma2 family endonuclease [Gammaproteobacteria bacterium]|nr:Uma2 family endonuclease [Gammaproteobacteria bacterium]
MAEASPQRVSPELSAGNLDSQVLGLLSDNPQALRRLVEELGGGFRKAFCDLVAGVAEFMSPSRAHEFTSRDIRDLVLTLCHTLGIDVVDMGATSITAPDGSHGDPDESFLIGARATAYRALEAQHGADAAMGSLDGKPPDLAVEVEHTSYQPHKPGLYRRCGVPELWDLGTAEAARGPVIYDLQADDGPRALPASRPLPGVRADQLPAAASTLRDLGGPLAIAARGEAAGKRVLEVACGRSSAPPVGPPSP